MHQALGGPLGMSRMRFGHVLRERGVPAASRGARMACHALTTGQDLYRASGEPHLDPLLHQRVGHRVVMAVDLDVVVDVHPRDAPLGPST